MVVKRAKVRPYKTVRLIWSLSLFWKILALLLSACTDTSTKPCTTKGTKKCEKRDAICDVRYLGISVILNRLRHEFFAVPGIAGMLCEKRDI
ncbi:hypothetical protein BpHYR1_009618 [Brachionus plicatilis]|uniref:Uncharacterized protein n=1 Tax=Brachionus plicatilis TaxID=10195 RepID=A0A3M7QER7_BRAPC|nr:hypothetical protein BpHYR1_009618 [Brachionus plicatilis]